MGINKVRTVLLAGGVAAAMALSANAAAAGDDLNCGDQGTYPNMTMTVFDPAHQPGDEGYDPHGLDADSDGIGCEDPNAPMPGEPGHPETPAPVTPEPPATTAPQPETPVAPPAPPIEAEPDFTG